MKLGILNTCTPADEKDFDEEEFVNFQAFFNLAEHNFELIEYRVTEGQFPSNGDCEAYLITGSPKGVYDKEAWIARLGDFIRETHAQQRKLVGICFGHQILAHALGGQAEKSEKGWGIGLQSLPITGEEPWMSPALPQGAFYYCHQDQVTRLPEGAKLLAGSKFCPNGMFAIGDLVLGLQAHPEFTDEVMGKTISWLQKNEKIDAQAAARAGQANGSATNGVMAQWIVNFLSHNQVPLQSGQA